MIKESYKLKLAICRSDSQWNAAKHFRTKYFFDKVPIKDPYEWTFTDPEHRHLVLYSGIEIVGCAHVQIWPENRAILRIIVIDETKQKSGLGSHFLNLIEKRLKLMDTKSLHTDSNKEALGFYRHQGYIEMPLNDPDGVISDPADTAIGKLL